MVKRKKQTLLTGAAHVPLVLLSMSDSISPIAFCSSIDSGNVKNTFGKCTGPKFG